MCRLVADTRSLTALNLWGSQLGDAGAEALASALAWHRPPHDHNHDHGGDGFAHDHDSAVSARWPGSSLTALDLGFNAVSDVGVAALALALAANQKLATLDLRKNQVTTAGVEALCKVRAASSGKDEE